jgi:hypothetical protein
MDMVAVKDIIDQAHKEQLLALKEEVDKRVCAVCSSM